MGYLFVSMSVISGSADVSSEWLKEHRAWLSNPCSRRPYETQKHVYNRTTPVALVQFSLNVICDDSPVSGGVMGSNETRRLVVSAKSERSSPCVCHARGG